MAYQNHRRRKAERRALRDARSPFVVRRLLFTVRVCGLVHDARGMPAYGVAVPRTGP